MDTILTNFFSILPNGFFVGILSFFICYFIFLTILDIIEV